MMAPERHPIKPSNGLPSPLFINLDSESCPLGRSYFFTIICERGSNRLESSLAPKPER